MPDYRAYKVGEDGHIVGLAMTSTFQRAPRKHRLFGLSRLAAIKFCPSRLDEHKAFKEREVSRVTRSCSPPSWAKAILFRTLPKGPLQV
jgi:hypothetical protein